MAADMKKYTVKVRKDGSGDAETIAEAIEIAEAMQQNAGEEEIMAEINIGAGRYKEKLQLEQNHVSFVARGQDEVIIEYGDYALMMLPDGIKRGTFRTQTVFVRADDFSAKNITFCNTAGFGAKVGQAVAFYADGTRMTFEGCRFLGRQDTLFTAPLPPSVVEAGGFRGPGEHAPRRNGVHYYKDCYIEGDVDFIFGGATAFFEGCEIRSLNRGEDINGYVTAASTPEGREYGYVFDHCRFTSDCPPETVYLGRPWRPFAKTVIMNSELGAHIKREGWHDWNKADARKSVFYAEYGNVGPGADTSGRVDWCHMLTAEEAAHFAKERVLSGTFSLDTE